MKTLIIIAAVLMTGCASSGYQYSSGAQMGESYMTGELHPMKWEHKRGYYAPSDLAPRIIRQGERDTRYKDSGGRAVPIFRTGPPACQNQPVIRSQVAGIPDSVAGAFCGIDQ